MGHLALVVLLFLSSNSYSNDAFDINSKKKKQIADVELDQSFLEEAMRGYEGDDIDDVFVSKPGLSNKEIIDFTESEMGVDVSEALGVTEEELERGPAKFSSSLEDGAARHVIFVSQSMGNDFGRIIQYGLENGAAVVMRGVNEGQSIDEVMGLLSLNSDADITGELRLDPRAFSEANITKVPALLVKTAEGNVLFRGRVNIPWAEQQIADFGVKEYEVSGTLFDISELDLIEDMKRRMQSVDFQELAKGASKRYFENHHNFVRLDRAKKDADYLIDPSMIATRDVEIFGKQLESKGAVKNPLDYVTLRKIYVVVNPMDDVQLARLDGILDNPEFKGKPTTLLLTVIPSEDYFFTIKSLQERYKAEAYLYTSDVAEKFDVDYVPAVVTQHENKLRIREYGENYDGFSG